MNSAFLFSNSIRHLGQYLKFQFIKSRRWISILFKRNRKLSKISFDYYKNWHFEEGLLLIDFQFNNAIWYKTESLKSVDVGKPIILNIQNIKSEILEFEVYGFFQKQIFHIQLNKEAHIDSTSFKTQLFNNAVSIDSNCTIKTPKLLTQIIKPFIILDAPTVTLRDFSTQNNQITIIHSQFKTQDYI